MPFSVAFLLLFAIVAGRIGVLLPIPLPIPGMLSPPLMRTVPTDLPIFGISSELLLVVLAAPPLLAVRIAANYLQGLIFRCLEVLLTIAAAPFAHDRRCRTSTKPAALETKCRVLTASPPMASNPQLQSRRNRGHFKPALTPLSIPLLGERVNKWIAAAAHSRGLSVALKNDVD
jgi:hypothetical protein